MSDGICLNHLNDESDRSLTERETRARREHMIVWDDKEKRMVDEENGDYLEVDLRNREEHQYTAKLRTREGVAYLGSLLTRDHVKEFENVAGGATVARWILNDAWVPSGQAEIAPGHDVPDALIRRLELFLRSQLERQTWLRFMPRFEFVDARCSKGTEL